MALSFSSSVGQFNLAINDSPLCAMHCANENIPRKKSVVSALNEL